MTRRPLLCAASLAALALVGCDRAGIAYDGPGVATRHSSWPGGMPAIDLFARGAVTEDGSLRVDLGRAPTDDPVLRPAIEDERFRRAVAGPRGVTAVTNRGRLYRVTGAEVRDLGVRVQPGSRLAAGKDLVWIAGEAGGLSYLDANDVLHEAWETGESPTTALAARGERVLVGRSSGAVESTRESEPGARSLLFRFDASVSALAMDDAGRAAAADERGFVRRERAREREEAFWTAGGRVIALAFGPPENLTGALGLAAVVEDGRIEMFFPGARRSSTVLAPDGDRPLAAGAGPGPEGEPDEGVRRLEPGITLRLSTRAHRVDVWIPGAREHPW